jgi:hypothetical protein
MCLPASLLDLPSRISLFLPGFPHTSPDHCVSPMDLSVSTLHAASPCISFLCLLWISYPESLCISFGSLVSPICLPVSPLDLQFRTSLYLPSHNLPISSWVSSELYFPSRIYLCLPGSCQSPCIFHASFYISARFVIPDFPKSPLNFPSWISVYESPCIFLCLLWISYRDSPYIAREASYISFVPSMSPCISSNCPKNSLNIPWNSHHEFSYICHGLDCSLDFSGSSCRFLGSPIRNLPDPLVSPPNLPGFSLDLLVPLPNLPIFPVSLRISHRSPSFFPEHSILDLPVSAMDLPFEIFPNLPWIFLFLLWISIQDLPVSPLPQISMYFP